MATAQCERTGRREVALFGTFDTANFGDCLFPPIVRHQLNKRIADVALLPFSPTSRLVKTATYSRVYAFRELGEVFDRTLPAFVIGGGALLATEHVLFAYPEIRLSYPYTLKCWLLPAMIAASWGCPLILNGIGLGPFDGRYAEFAGTYLKGAEPCGVRDALTREFLADLGVSAETVPDSGLLTPELLDAGEWARMHGGLKDEFGLPDRYLAVQASLYLRSHLEPFTEEVAVSAQEAGLPVVVIPICHHLNDRVASRIMRRRFDARKVKTVVIDRVLNSLETSAVLSRTELYVGTSLHGALVTLAFAKQAVSFSLPMMKKNGAVLDALGVGDCLVGDTAQLRGKIHAALNGPPKRNEMHIAQAKARLAVFDRMSEVIWSRSGSPLAAPLTVELASDQGECSDIAKDWAHLRGLCRESATQIPLARRCGALLVRNYRPMSECYDRISHWLALRKDARRG